VNKLLTDTSPNKSIFENRNKILALVLFIFLIVLTIILFFSMQSWVAENDELQQPRTFHIPFGANYGNIALSATNGRVYDFEIDVTVSYTQSTLMVGDVVTIQAKAVINNQLQHERVHKILIGFENAERIPFHQTNNITDSLSMNLLINEDNEGEVTGQCLWETEGTYHMILHIVTQNSSGTFLYSQGICDNMALTVYPRTDMAQILTNKANITLTIALFALTLLSTLSLISSLWDRETKPKNPKQPENKSEKCNTQTNENTSKSKVKINNNKSSAKQADRETKHNKG
jgi:hypothetical protein